MLRAEKNLKIQSHKLYLKFQESRKLWPKAEMLRQMNTCKNVFFHEKFQYSNYTLKGEWHLLSLAV